MTIRVLCPKSYGQLIKVINAKQIFLPVLPVKSGCSKALGIVSVG
jgi:hypothetical protein